jgi:hypothetical protein
MFARLALRVHLRWLQLDLPKVSFVLAYFASASPEALVPFGTVPAVAGQATPCHQALGGRQAVPPSGSRYRVIFYLSIRPDQTSFVLLDSGLLGPPASND